MTLTITRTVQSQCCLLNLMLQSLFNYPGVYGLFTMNRMDNALIDRGFNSNHIISTTPIDN